MARTRRRWSDRVKDIYLPLFPGYVFCRLDTTRPQSVLECPGVVDIIAFGSRPAPIAENEIETVRVIVNSSLLVQPHPFLAAGQEICITQGPLTGARGVITEIKKEFRLVASVGLLQRSVAVELDPEWVSPLS